MTENGGHFHYVCTHDEALDLVNRREHFWISNCGCREDRGNQCRRSSMEVCLQFNEATAASGSARRAVSKAEVMELLQESASTRLVARPFRKDDDFSITDGICFCCDDCCGYFLNPLEECDKGAVEQKTDLEACIDCGICEEVCYFMARQIINGELTLSSEACYGCGLCLAVCPGKCIQMIPRN
jgi:NAD-dependent dihydropyrimidine dehydrogenase PreA subunit